MKWTFRFFAILIFVVIFFGSQISYLITNYMWFSALGFSTLFTTTWITRAIMFALFAIVSYAIIWINVFIAGKNSNIPKRIATLVTAIISLIIGSIAIAGWDVVQKMLNQVPFGVTDPIFGKDIAFYIFTLPFYELILKSFMFIIAISFVGTILMYLTSIMPTLMPKMTTDQYGNRTPDFSNMKKKSKPMPNKAKAHLAILGGIFFLLLGAQHYLSRYNILYSTRGVIYGAGFTEATVMLPALSILVGVTILVGIAIFAWSMLKKKQVKKIHLLTGAIVMYVAVLIIGTSIIPALVQNLKVSPNELEIEKPYIVNGIKYTRMAYGLNNVLEENFPVSQNLTAADIENNPETINNIRLLDWRPLMQTYKQLQEIRLYYDFMGIDVDRYNINGEYRQVMLSAREMRVNQLSPQAQTWVNQHLIYTHGYGAAVSPVNEVTKEGQPEFILKDIPPQTNVPELEITRPEIYYGEHNNDFAIVKTTQKEFDYPKGDQNIFTTYKGDGGVVLGGFWRRLILALRFGDIKMLISSTIDDESRVMFNRNIKQRVNTLTPFIALDDDPYLVIADGKQYWMLDGYTVSNRYPYSEPKMGINYIRNSVKIVVDAYHGTVTYYMIGKDPIMKTWSRVFPKQFKDISEMPKELQKHLRYPEGLFRIQAEMYATYHMNDPGVFYNKEDVWELPNEIYGQGQQVRMDPYYVIIKLPDWDKEEFTMMMPFTPSKRDNMIAWMAAKSDEHYGELVLYKFPKDKLVYGPMQIEAKVDQDADISEQLTLWDQSGSSVTRGNVLVIPIETSVLYVEPLYIQAEKSQMPELKRVIVSDGTVVVMEQTFKKALARLLLETKGELIIQTPEYSKEDIATIMDAWNAYKAAQEGLGNGNWTGFGTSMDKLGGILEQLAAEEN